MNTLQLTHACTRDTLLDKDAPPDPDGKQLEAIREHLLEDKNNEIKYMDMSMSMHMWFDYW